MPSPVRVAQLSRIPAAALLLTIPEQAVQLVLRGPVARLAGPALATAYGARSRYLQLLAWLNTTEMAGLDPGERRSRWAAFADAHPPGSLTAPPDWTGFVLRPTRVTIWRGDLEGPSQRTEYQLESGDWSTEILPG